jgi:carboxyl-terminal processing protease
MSPIQVMGAYNQFIKKHRDAKGIIVDVRGNGGGSGDIAIGMIGWLMSGEKESMGKVILRNDELNLIVRPRPNPFQGPVAVLIDEMSVSAAEFFASGIKDLTAARVFGTTTAGAVLGSQIEKLPTGDGFQFAAANFISNRTGRTLEGVGVSPHEVVEPERAALLAGKDPAREAAIRWIQSQSR